MIFKKNINHNEQINSIDKNQMEFILKYGKRSNVLNKKECKQILEFSYQIVKIDLPELIQKSQWIEIAELLFETKFKKIKSNDLLNFILWVTDELENIYKTEKIKLDSPPDNEMLMAGINELNVFGELNAVDILAGGDILKWELILQQPYYRCLDKLIKNNIERQIQKNYQKIIEAKNKKR